MIRVAIVGGGISGLSAAFYLDKAKRAGAQLDYTLFESSDRLGGVIHTERRDDFVIDAGPDSFLTAKPWATELARELNIAGQLIGSNDATRKTYILLKGRLVPMPDGLQMMVPTKVMSTALSPLFSLATKFRMLRECLSPPQRLAEGKDESVGNFVNRHFGEEVTRVLAAPLLAGVYGGDADRLSVRAVLPRFVELEAAHGSLVRGIVAAKGVSKDAAPTPLFSTFRLGMQQLTDAITARLQPTNIRLDCEIRKLGKTSNAWRIDSADQQSMSFDRVILAMPAYSSARLLWEVDAQLAAVLDEIPYCSSATVAVAYEQKQLAGVRLPQGFGFLVPRSEKIPISACTFVQNKFNHRAPAGGALLRFFMPEALDWSGERIHAVVTQQIKTILRMTAPPREISISRWQRSMAQHEVGHLERVSAIEKATLRHPGLELIGNAYRGIGVPDCIREGKDAAGRVMKSILAQ